MKGDMTLAILFAYANVCNIYFPHVQHTVYAKYMPKYIPFFPRGAIASLPDAFTVLGVVYSLKRLPVVLFLIDLKNENYCYVIFGKRATLRMLA